MSRYLIEKAEEGMPQVDALLAAGFEPFAVVSEPVMQDAEGRYVNAEGDADARIMAAAPDLAATVIALSEREAATDAWLAEVGHLSLAAAGAELVHLRDREREMQYAYDCCVSFTEWANAPTNRKAHNMEDMPPVTADDAFSVVFPILQKERADLAVFANRIGAAISGRPYADVEENLRVDELPTVAAQVEALSERVAQAEKERDRLRLVLACERGEWAPKGWKWRLVKNDAWIDGFDYGVWAWCRGRSTRVVRSAQTGRWQKWAPMPGLRNFWTGQPNDAHIPTALEAIEHADAADLAAKETK